jgi:CheY-like chemotaxis protein
VWNLVNNAIRYTPAGGRVSVRTIDLSSGTVRLVVQDTGEGMSPDVLERIFQPFDQAGGLSEQRGGLGLGLAICKGLVDAHGGLITAFSDGVGQGAMFVVELPTVAGEDRSSRASVRADPSRAPRQLRVLLLEDNADAAEAMATALRLRGHEVTVSQRARDAIDMASRRFDVLVSDLGLPDGSGFDVMRAFAARQEVRGVAGSGYGTAEDVRLSHEAGFAHHLTKPVELDDLVDLVERPTDVIASTA